jgi:hypothetical protein
MTEEREMNGLGGTNLERKVNDGNSREKSRSAFVKVVGDFGGFMGMIAAPLVTILATGYAVERGLVAPQELKSNDWYLFIPGSLGVSWLPGGLMGAHFGEKIAGRIEKSIRRGLENEKMYCSNEKCATTIDRVRANYCPQCGDGLEE